MIECHDAGAILVVDDDEDVRYLHESMLRGAGYSVVTACDGVDALEKLDAGIAPRLIVLDIDMPNLDGPGFLDELARRPRRPIPTLVVTGHPFLRPPQATVCVVKPCQPTTLLDAVSKALGST